MYYNLTFSMITNMNAARSEFQNRMDAIKQVSNTQLYLIILLAQRFFRPVLLVLNILLRFVFTVYGVSKGWQGP